MNYAIPRQRIEETLALLCERHQNIFFTRSSQAAEGRYHNDVVLDQGINHALRTLANYVLELSYLKSQKAGEVRIDLDSNPLALSPEVKRKCQENYRYDGQEEKRPSRSRLLQYWAVEAKLLS
jgi:hypothetical protein